MNWLERRRIEAQEMVIAGLSFDEWSYSWDVRRKIRMRSGRYYPALRRLEQRGLIEARWENTNRKYPRRMYRLVERKFYFYDGAT